MTLFISDLDGTLLNTNQELSQNTIGIINDLIENRKLNFTIATARSLNSTMPLVNQLMLKHPIILDNGIFIYDPVKKKNIRELFLDFKFSKDLIKVLLSKNYHPIVHAFDTNNNHKVFYQDIGRF